MSSKSAQVWRRANELFATLVSLSGEERVATFETMEEPVEVKTAVRKLLDSLDRTSILDESIDDLFMLGAGSEESLCGKKFGDWVVGDVIGRGGMSVVYAATRTGERFEQHAAFKKLSVAFLSKRHIESFHRECKALATLNHPGIAKLIHSGVAENGAPYLIIERINGTPIDRHCRENSLGIRAIVRLMEKLSAAVAHAHRHLVVHRDINPANVLVDARGDPKLLDFGVAKMLDDVEPVQRLHAYTPGYAAPEQLADQTITTATDVFALGQLLNLLLRHHKPSEDLVAIAARATQIDANLRYTSARELGADLQAWLSNRPVSAVPDSSIYRLRKYSHRNWRWLSLAGVVLLAVTIGAASTAWQAEAAKLESSKRRAVADFMLDLFQYADVMESGADLRVTELLEIAAERAPRLLANQPEALVSLYNLIASGQIELTNYARAADVLGRAQDLLESQSFSAGTIANYQIQRGREAYELGRFADAVEYLKTAMRLLQTGQHNEMYFSAGANLVSYLVDTENYTDSLVLARRLMAKMRSAEPSPAIRSMVLHRYAVALEVNNDVDSAFKYYQEALDVLAAYDPENQLGRATILSDYGIALYLSERSREAEEVYQEVLSIFSTQFKPPHPRIAAAIHNLAFAIVEQDRLIEAIELLQQSYAMTLELHGPENIDSLLEQATLANVMIRAGDLQNAEPMLRENLITLARVAPNMNIQRGAVHGYLADLLFKTERYEESRAEYQAALVLFSSLSEDHPRVVDANQRLGEISSKLQ